MPELPSPVPHQHPGGDVLLHAVPQRLLYVGLPQVVRLLAHSLLASCADCSSFSSAGLYDVCTVRYDRGLLICSSDATQASLIRPSAAMAYATTACEPRRATASTRRMATSECCVRPGCESKLTLAAHLQVRLRSQCLVASRRMSSMGKLARRVCLAATPSDLHRTMS